MTHVEVSPMSFKRAWCNKQ